LVKTDCVERLAVEAWYRDHGHDADNNYHYDQFDKRKACAVAA
jgi:hypothetical protein